MSKQKMMNKEDAERFLFKVDMDGLSYAVENYAPKDTEDAKFNKILTALRTAQDEMGEYIDELRGVYDIEIC